MDFKEIIAHFTEELKAEENSAAISLVCKVAKEKERRKIWKWCRKTKGGRKVIRVESPWMGL